jgi:predicted Fe-Mo cluster-binding NifX family protein
MKIAVPTEGNFVSGHFGKCENFTIFDVDDSSIKNKTIINTVGNQHGLLPAFLASQNVNVY